MIHGTFEERSQAVAALDAMPAGLKQFRPYVRTLDGLRDDLRRADKR